MSPGDGSSLRVLSPFLWRRLASSLPPYSNGFLPVGARPVASFSAWPTPWHVMRRYTSSFPSGLSPPCAGSQPPDATGDDDPVLSFILPDRTMPLTQLAKLLPDEVLEKLENGLKIHLEKFPARYRLFRGKNGLLHVQLESAAKQKDKVKQTKDTTERAHEKKDVLPPDETFPGRFQSLESFMRLTHAACPLGAVDSHGSHEEKEEETIRMAKQFFYEHVHPVKRAELWVLTEEYTLMKSPSAEATAAATGPESTTLVDPVTKEAVGGKEVLQAFRWVHLCDVDKLNEAVGMLRREALGGAVRNEEGEETASHGGASSGTTFRSSTFVRFLVSTRACPMGAPPTPHCVENGIEEYNFYRMCRALSTTTFMRLPELQDVVAGWLTQPLAAVLAVAGEESKVTVKLNGVCEKRSLLDFEFDPDDPNRIVGVRFWLDEERYLPPQYRSMAPEEMEKELSELVTTTSKNLSQLPNHKRVRIIDRKRLLKRCIALHELGTTPMCHPDVLAYYVFDTLPLDGQLILTGHLPLLLQENIRHTTDARCRAWLKRYPHLFRLVEVPPEIYVQRMDVPASDNEGDDKQYGSQRVKGEEQDTEAGTLRASCENKQRLLNDPEEQLRFVVSIVAARLEICGARKLLPSHLPKFISSDVRRKIFPRGSGGAENYLMRYPDVFILTRGVHPHEPVVTLTPKYHPNLRQSSANATGGADAGGATEKGE